MRIEVADRAVDLRRDRHRVQGFGLALEPGDQVGQLFAQRRGAGRLTMGARQHGLLGRLCGERAQFHRHLAQCRQCEIIAAAAQHQRVGNVVDVL